MIDVTVCQCVYTIINWGERERAPTSDLYADVVCLSVCLSVMDGTARHVCACSVPTCLGYRVVARAHSLSVNSKAPLQLQGGETPKKKRARA